MFREEINRTVRKVRQGCPKVTAHIEPPPEGEGQHHRGFSAALHWLCLWSNTLCIPELPFPLQLPQSRQHLHCKVCMAVIFLHIL